jgi:hypothetical protein
MKIKSSKIVAPRFYGFRYKNNKIKNNKKLQINLSMEFD